LYFHRGEGAASKLWTAARSGPFGSFSAPGRLGLEGSDTNADSDPSMSEDGRTLYFASLRDAAPKRRVWMATRPSTAAAFGSAVMLKPSPGATLAAEPFVSAADDELFFAQVPQAGADVGNGRAGLDLRRRMPPLLRELALGRGRRRPRDVRAPSP
jgi:hypothetical protein